jgi:hypothetical protein
VADLPSVLERVQDEAAARVAALALPGVTVYTRLAEDVLRSRLPGCFVFWAEGPGRRYERFSTEHDVRLYELGVAVLDRMPLQWEENRARYGGWGEALETLFLSEGFLRPAVPEVLDVEVDSDVLLRERDAYQLLVSGWTLHVRCVTRRAA